MKSAKSRSTMFLLALSLASITAALLYCKPWSGSLHCPWAFFWHRLGRPLIRLSIFISIGLFVAQLIEATGWTDKLTLLARPLMRWGRLTPQMGAAFTAAFFSGVTSLSMITAFHKEGAMSERELKLSVLLNTFPSYFLHLPTTFFIILPLVGKAGLLYLLLTFSAALIRLLVVLVYCHFSLPVPQKGYSSREHTNRRWSEIFNEIGRKFATRLRRILLIVLPVYVMIALVSKLGLFLWLRKLTANIFTTNFVPIEAMSIVIFSIVAEFTSGYAAAGAMLDSGALTVFQTVLALLAGNIIATPIRSLRHQMPYYMGIFDPRVGVKLMLLTQAFRVGSLAVVAAVFVLSHGLL